MGDHPKLIEGASHVDTRGSLDYFNDFEFGAVERFYIIRPRRPRAVRGWIGHRREHKWFTAVEGVVLVAVVRTSDWRLPEKDSPVLEFVLSAENPRILYVPPGNAMAIVGVSPHSTLVVFSSGAAGDSAADTFRFDPDQWAIPSLGKQF
jgi:dTDP-4-dehydrorhamnose 3,5-epimerase-like enzyme